MPLFIKKDHPVQIHRDKINKLIDSCEKYNNNLIDAVIFHSGGYTSLNHEYMAVQQQLELLKVIKKYIDAMLWNIFLPLEDLQRILQPTDNATPMELTAENAQAYFDAVCREITNYKYSNSQFRSKLINFLIGCVILSVILGCVTLVIGCLGMLTPVSAGVMGALIGLFSTAIVPLSATLNEKPGLIKNEAYLDAIKQNKEPELLTEKHYFSFDPTFPLKHCYDPLAIRITIEKNSLKENIYCHIPSEEKCNSVFFRYATVKLSDGLAPRIIAKKNKNLNDNWYQAFMDEIKHEIQSRRFTAMIGNGQKDDRGNTRYYLEDDRGTLKTTFFKKQPILKTMFLTQSPIDDHNNPTISNHIFQMSQEL